MHNALDLEDLRLFAVVVKSPSLARAAAELGISPSTVSKRLTVLESRLGVRVLHRTTRSISLTDDGDTVYRWAQRLLSIADDMVQELSITDGQPKGVLRVSTSSGFGRNHVASVISRYASLFPEVEIRLDTLDRPVNIVSEGFDIDIRLGGLREPHLFARKIISNDRIVCGSPNYFARYGRPKSIEDLAHHRCLLIHERDQPYGVWYLEGPKGLEMVRVRSWLSTNLGEIAHRWALDGHGIILRSMWDVMDGLKAGALERVLVTYRQEADAWGVYPNQISRSPKLSHFLDLLIEHFRQIELSHSVHKRTPLVPGSTD